MEKVNFFQYLFRKNTKDKIKGKLFLKFKEMIDMIKQMAWNTFKNTGNIDTYLELTQMKKIEDEILLGEKYGDNQNKGNNNSGK